MSEKPSYEELEKRTTEFKKTERYLENILNSSWDLICILGRDGYLHHAAASWEHVFGYTQNDLLTKPFLDFIHPDDREKTNQAVKKLTTGQLTVDFENRCIGKDGAIRNINWRASSATGEKQIYCIGHDITRQRQLETLISKHPIYMEPMIPPKTAEFSPETNDCGPSGMHRETENHYRGIVEEAPLLICNFLADGTLTFVNKSYCKYFDRSPEALVGSNFLERIVESDRKTVIELISTLTAASATASHEHRVTLSTGDIRWQGWSYHALFGARGSAIGHQAIGKDITDRKRFETALNERKNLFRSVFNQQFQFMAILTPEGRIIEINDLPLRVLGAQREDYSGEIFWETPAWENLPEWREHIKNNIQKAASMHEPIISENKFQTVDGSIRMANTAYTTIRDAQNNVRYILVQATDITERKQAELKLQENEQRFREFFNHMSAGAAIYSSPDNGNSFVFRDLNKSGADNARKRVDEVIGQEVRDIFPGVEALGLFDVFRRVWKTGIPEHHPSRLYKDGRIELWVENYVCKLPSGELVAIYNDTTARKKAEEALAKSEERLKLTLDAVSDAVWDWQVDTGEVYFSSRWYTMLGYEPHQFPPSYETWKNLIHPDDFPIAAEALTRHLKSGEPFEKEFRMRANGGQWKWILGRGNVVKKNARGKSLRMLGTHQDITERKELERQILQAQKMESIGNLAGGIAHDFNNILFPIIGMSELLLEDLPSDSNEHENAEEILLAGKRGADLVKQILAFSRQAEHKMIPIRPQQIVNEVLKLSRSTIPSNIEITAAIQQNCGLVMADPTQLHQIAMNLITNAYHAVEGAGGNISIQLKETHLQINDVTGTALEPGPYALLSISDTGCGINPDMMNKIFDPYFTTKVQGKGTGLGLAVVYGIVKGHKGEISVFSELGKGTRFDIYLPLMERCAHADSAEQGLIPVAGNERILLVDDEKPIARLESQILERLGYQVTSRLNSVEALEAFKAKPEAFDLVLTDMSMPTMTGDQLAREILSINPNMPIIISTGFSERISPHKAAELGVKGILMKPVVRAEMALIVRKALDEAQHPIAK